MLKTVLFNIFVETKIHFIQDSFMNNKEKHLIVTEFFNNVIVFPVILIYFNVFL